MKLKEYVLSANTGLDAIKRAPIVDYDTGLKCIRIQDISQNKTFEDWGDTLTTSSDYTKFRLRVNDILVARTGATVGVSYIVLENYNAVFNNGTIRLKLKDNCNPKFIYYVLQTREFMQYIDNVSCVATQPNLRVENLLRFYIPDLSVEKQNQIATFLSKYDDLIDNNNKRIKIIEQMAENLYKEWFVRFRFPGYETTEFENGIPKRWEYVKLGEKLRFERGVGYSSADLMDSDNVLLSMNNIRPWGGFIRDYSRKYSGKFKEFQVVKSNDLVMSITDMTQDRRIIGYVGLVPSSNQTRIMCTHLMKVVALQKEYQTTFLYGLFNFSGLSRCISERATGANVLGLTANILNNVKWYLPNVDLISEYCSIVNPLYEAIEQYENKNENLIKQRDMLLPRLMSGKLEVN